MPTTCTHKKVRRECTINSRYAAVDAGGVGSPDNDGAPSVFNHRTLHNAEKTSINTLRNVFCHHLTVILQSKTQFRRHLLLIVLPPKKMRALIQAAKIFIKRARLPSAGYITRKRKRKIECACRVNVGFFLLTLASGAFSRHATAGTSAAHSFKRISNIYPLTGAKNEREAEEHAPPSMQELEAKLTRFRAEVTNKKRIQKLEKEVARLRPEIAASQRSHAAVAAPNSTSLHSSAEILAAGMHLQLLTQRHNQNAVAKN